MRAAPEDENEAGARGPERPAAGPGPGGHVRREQPIEQFTIGMEEEYLVVDATTHALRPRAGRILPRARQLLGDAVQPELQLSQIEVGTPVCHTLAELRAEIGRLRRVLSGLAAEEASAIVASGTHPFSEWLGQSITPGSRYERIEAAFQHLAWEQQVCGCHVHVCIPDRDLAIEVMDRSRQWLPTLLALTTNSPYWEGIDTGYSSYRTQIFGRWPTAGIPQPLGDRATYDAVVRDLVASGSIEDATFLYWDVRPSSRFPTVEYRVADVCTTVDESVMLAGLVRSLARTCVRNSLAGLPVPQPRQELLAAARWRACRFGLEGDLVDVAAVRPRPAAEVVVELLRHLRPDLEDSGEWDEVEALVRQVLARGTGAARQRRIAREKGGFAAVLAHLVAETARA